MLNEEDALVVDALQLAPRAPWSAVGDVLGIAPTTAAKRFQRLVDEGVAWVTASPGMMTSSPQCYAHVEITCRSDVALQRGQRHRRASPRRHRRGHHRTR